MLDTANTGRRYSKEKTDRGADDRTAIDFRSARTTTPATAAPPKPEAVLKAGVD